MAWRVVSWRSVAAAAVGGNSSGVWWWYWWQAGWAVQSGLSGRGRYPRYPCSAADAPLTAPPLPHLHVYPARQSDLPAPPTKLCVSLHHRPSCAYIMMHVLSLAALLFTYKVMHITSSLQWSTFSYKITHIRSLNALLNLHNYAFVFCPRLFFVYRS